MILTFRKFFSFCLLSFVALSSPAQRKNSGPAAVRIPMEPAYWQYDTAGAEFIVQDGQKAIRMKNGSAVIPKGIQFVNGTIEYDVSLTLGFPGISFRLSEDGRNGDQFYLRYFGTTSPESRTSLQYAAIIDSTSIWDLSDEYQAGASLRIPGWNHVKLVISGKQLKAYVNDMSRPALLVPQLEGTEVKGALAFSGGLVSVANFVVKPDVVEDVTPAAGYHPTHNDTRYLRHWRVGKPIDFPFGREIATPLSYRGGIGLVPEYPDSTASWVPLAAENRGLVNLTRILGATKVGQRRLVWIKTEIGSAKEQERKLHLGFSDEVWVFVNGEMVYAGKNHFNSPMDKFPSGRCTIENAAVALPLKQGKNEVLMAVANYFYGWGVIARLDEMEGVSLVE